MNKVFAFLLLIVVSTQGIAKEMWDKQSPVAKISIYIDGCDSTRMPRFIKVSINNESEIDFRRSRDESAELCYVKTFSAPIDYKDINSLKIVSCEGILIDDDNPVKNYDDERKELVCQYSSLFRLKVYCESPRPFTIKNVSDKSYKDMQGNSPVICARLKKKHKLVIQTIFGGAQGFVFEDEYSVSDIVKKHKYHITLSEKEVRDNINKKFQKSNNMFFSVPEKASFLKKITYELEVADE